MKGDMLVRLGEDVARLGKPLHLGEGRLCLGKPVTGKQWYVMTCLGPVRGLVCDWL